MKNRRIQLLKEFNGMIDYRLPENNVIVTIKKTDAEEEEIRRRE